MDKNGNIEMKRILDIFKSKSILIVFILIVFVLLGYVYSYYYVVPKYKSTETLLLIPNNTFEDKTITTSDLTLNSELITTYSSIAKQSRVLKKVIENLDLNMTQEELLNEVQVNVLSGTYIIEIIVENKNPEYAMNITKEISTVFLNEIKEIYNLENIGIVDEAELASVPYNINHVKDIAMFFALGIIVSCACIIAIYVFDNTLKSEEEIEKYVKIKTLGKIPVNTSKGNEIVNRDNAKSYITECINTIRTNILYMTSIKTAKTILVTSCMSQEGKSFTSANIAASFAETNKKVLIIDADMRKGRANKIFNVDNIEGLSNYLYFMTGDVEKDLELGKKYIKETEIPNLHILTNGTIPPNPSELIDSETMKELISLLKKVYDIVIIDAPPCKLVTDSIILSRIVDSSILVVSSEKTKIDDLIEVKKSIDNVGGKIIGAILNKVRIPEKIYSKSYYYGNAKEEDKCEVAQKEIISVSQIIEEAKDKLKQKEYDISLEEHNAIIDEIKDDEIQNKENDILKNEYLEKIINTVSDIKVQLNNNRTKNNKLEEMINKQFEELHNKNQAEIKEEIQNINYKNKLDEILSKLENVKANSEDVSYNEIIEKIFSQLREMKVDYEQLANKVKDTEYLDTLIEKLRQERITKEEIEDIVKEGSITRREIQDIVRQGSITRREIQDIIRQESITKEEIEAIVNQESIARKEIEDTIKQKIITKEQVQNIIKQEILNIDYKKQFEQISEMLSGLKDEYLTLLNQINTKDIEIEKVNTGNIIDIKVLKREKQTKKKKTVYSIKEDISYSDLEKSAFCIIPFNTKNTSDFSDESYGNMIAIK